MFSLALFLLLCNIAIMIYASSNVKCSQTLPYESFNFKGCKAILIVCKKNIANFALLPRICYNNHNR